MGSILGVQKIAAKRIGISYEEYLEKTKDFKWCWKCKCWKFPTEFNKDIKRGDGLSAICHECSRVKQKIQRKIFNASQKQKQKAVDAIRFAIKKNRLVKPTSCPCFYCGNPAEQYHHHLGYSDAHLLDVRATCRKCHINQHWDN